MEFEIINEPRDQNMGSFKVMVEGEAQGALEYTIFGSGRLVINHTEVARSLQGTGAASSLIYAAADFARRENYRIVPICPFAKKYMTSKREEFADVLV